MDSFLVVTKRNHQNNVYTGLEVALPLSGLEITTAMQTLSCNLREQLNTEMNMKLTHAM